MNHKEYQGHESYNAWNVSLWINNDEGLYRLAREYKRKYKTARKTAAALMEVFKESNYLKTPDGVPYSKHTIELAIGDI